MTDLFFCPVCLQKNTALKTLGLSSNNIGDVGATALAGGIEVSFARFVSRSCFVWLPPSLKIFLKEFSSRNFLQRIFLKEFERQTRHPPSNSMFFFVFGVIAEEQEHHDLVPQR